MLEPLRRGVTLLLSPDRQFGGQEVISPQKDNLQKEHALMSPLMY